MSSVTNRPIASTPPASILDTPLWVIVPAAGTGQRLGGDIAKQYQLLDGVSMLERTVARLLELPELAGLVVVLAKNDDLWSTLFSDGDARIVTTTGGDTRAESVLAGIECALRHATDETWMMVHDAARPLVAISDIQRLINVVYNNGAIGGLLATPVQDTLKKADEYASVIQTVERQDLWHAQTPQMFRGAQLRSALENALRTQPEAITDEASAMELAGHDPQLVEALRPNVKITRPVDQEMANALLRLERLSKDVAPA